MSEFIVIGQRAEDGIAIDFSKPAVGELVRCKDCIHNGSIDTDCPFGWKDKKFNMPSPNDYCSYGERKEQEHGVHET